MRASPASVELNPSPPPFRPSVQASPRTTTPAPFAMCSSAAISLHPPSELWQRMYDATSYVGQRGLVMHAISGVDLALWDLYGKICGKPSTL